MLVNQYVTVKVVNNKVRIKISVLLLVYKFRIMANKEVFLAIAI